MGLGFESLRVHHWEQKAFKPYGLEAFLYYRKSCITPLLNTYSHIIQINPWSFKKKSLAKINFYWFTQGLISFLRLNNLYKQSFNQTLFKVLWKMPLTMHLRKRFVYFFKKINIWQHLHIFDMNLVVSQSWMISRFSLALISFKFAKSILV